MAGRYSYGNNAAAVLLLEQYEGPLSEFSPANARAV